MALIGDPATLDSRAKDELSSTPQLGRSLQRAAPKRVEQGCSAGLAGLCSIVLVLMQKCTHILVGLGKSGLANRLVG